MAAFKQNLQKFLGSLAAACSLFAATASAEPLELAIQGRLGSGAGGPVADGTYGMAIAFFDQLVGSNQAYKELFIAVPVSAGVFTVALGAADLKLDSNVFAAGKPLYVGVTIGADPELPRQPLRRVPYAVQSLLAAQAADLQCSGCVGADDLAKGAVTAEKIADGAVGAQKVAFKWAAADVAGGTAVAALTALTADQAKLALTAEVADEAVLAKDLQCSGCVHFAALAKDSVDAFVSTKGGTVTGTLNVNGELALGASAISGGRFAGVDVKKAPCTGNEVGRVVLDSTSKRLYFCDSVSWRRISSCLGVCKQAVDVACGTPIYDDCGDVGVCLGTGSACGGGKTCTAGVCVGKPGQSADSPAKNCKEVLAAGLNVDGLYWLDSDGPGNTAPFQAWCDQTTDGGGWTRCGWVDEVKANDNNLVINEGNSYLDFSKLQNASFCGKWYSEQAPQEMLFHNLTVGADYGEAHKVKVRWGKTPFKLYTYNNAPLELCVNLTTNTVFAGCQYAAHQGWEDTSFSFTTGGMASGYSGNQDKRLILGPTSQPVGNKQWHNFGANTNAHNLANDWAGGMAIGYLSMR